MRNYTDTLNETVRDTVRRIDPGTLDAFRSHIYSWTHADDIVWREAAIDPVSKTWTVTHCEAVVPPAGSGPRKVNTYCTYGLCFFDALYSVARVDAEPELLGLGERIDDVPAFIIPPHHKAEAEKIGVPYDDELFPIPTVNGRIMVPGSFNEDAFSIAARSVNNVSAPKSEQPLLSGAVPVKSGVTALSLQTSLSPVHVARLENKRGQYLDVVDSQSRNISAVSEWGFANRHAKRFLKGAFTHVASWAGMGTGVASIMFVQPSVIGGMGILVGIASIFSAVFSGAFVHDMLKYRNVSFPAYNAYRLRQKLKKITAELPPGSALHRDFKRFHSEVEIGYQLVQTKRHFNNVAAGHFGASFLLSRSMNRLGRLCDESGMTPERKQAFLEALNKDSINDLSDRVAGHIRSRAYQIEKNLSLENLHKLSAPTLARG